MILSINRDDILINDRVSIFFLIRMTLFWWSRYNDTFYDHGNYSLRIALFNFWSLALFYQLHFYFLLLTFSVVLFLSIAELFSWLLRHFLFSIFKTSLQKAHFQKSRSDSLIKFTITRLKPHPHPHPHPFSNPITPL